MATKSKGPSLLRAIRRHVSTDTSQQSASDAAFAKRMGSSTTHTKPSRIPPPKPKTQTSEPGQKVPPSEQTQPKRRRVYEFLHGRKYRFYRQMILISPGVLLLCMHSPYSLLTVTGPSMSPFLNPNDSDSLPGKDQILVRSWHSMLDGWAEPKTKKGSPREQGATEFQRGQIITFHTPHDPEKVAVKRVVAIPGDMVQPLPGYPGGDEPVVIPWNHLWVEGDVDSEAEPRAKSVDSNWYGPISQNLVLGEVKAVWSSGWTWNWINWKNHRWPASERGRVEENVVAEAVVDPDVVKRNSGWTDGSISFFLEKMKKHPDQMLHRFVNDFKTRQEARRLYNNAVYVTRVANSEQEKTLAQSVVAEMETIYGREALVFGIRVKRPPRERGDIANSDNAQIGLKAVKDPNASAAEKWLGKQGWALEKDPDGFVKTRTRQ